MFPQMLRFSSVIWHSTLGSSASLNLPAFDSTKMFTVVSLSLNLRAFDSTKMFTVISLRRKHSTDYDAKGGEDHLTIDCGSDAKSVAGGVVALGKFDALHVGHRALAIQASRMGAPFLLSFTGMAEVLNWEKRLPIVAPCDRKRVMSLWAEVCGGAIPRECHLEFAKLRTLSPMEFVRKLAKDLGVKGVVAGANYRFGYKAAGDASDLVQFCGKFGLDAYIVDPVMDEVGDLSKLSNGFEVEGDREKGQVSSTRVRKALRVGDMVRVAKLLGRDYRLMLAADGCSLNANVLRAPMLNALNQVPIDGIYSSKVYLNMDGGENVSKESAHFGEVEIGNGHIVVKVQERSLGMPLQGQKFVGVELQHRLSDHVT